MGNICTACEYNDENRTNDLPTTTKQRHLKMQSNFNQASEINNRRSQKEFKPNMYDSDISSPHQPKNAMKVDTMNRLADAGAKAEEQKGPFKVRYIDDNINNGAPMLGPYQYEEGETYFGQYFNGMKHGKGRMIWPDGSIYEGQWLNDKRHGKGRIVYSQGDMYEGEWFLIIDFFNYFLFGIY